MPRDLTTPIPLLTISALLEKIQSFYPNQDWTRPSQVDLNRPESHRALGAYVAALRQHLVDAGEEEWARWQVLAPHRDHPTSFQSLVRYQLELVEQALVTGNTIFVTAQRLSVDYQQFIEWRKEVHKLRPQQPTTRPSGLSPAGFTSMNPALQPFPLSSPFPASLPPTPLHTTMSVHMPSSSAAIRAILPEDRLGFIPLPTIELLVDSIKAHCQTLSYPNAHLDFFPIGAEAVVGTYIKAVQDHLLHVAHGRNIEWNRWDVRVLLSVHMRHPCSYQRFLTEQLITMLHGLEAGNLDPDCVRGDCKQFFDWQREVHNLRPMRT